MMRKLFLTVWTGLLLLVLLPLSAQETKVTINGVTHEAVVKDSLKGKKTYSVDGMEMNDKQLHRYYKKLRKDSIREKKKIWWSVFGGPSYTPEASLGVGGAVLASFRMNRNDTVSQRSFIPAGVNVSLNGTIVVAGAGTLFFNENKFRIYLKYAYRNEPAHYYGRGMHAAEHTLRSDSTTEYHRNYFQFFPSLVWEVRPHVYVGGLVDLNYTKSYEINPVMALDPYFNKYKPSYFNAGVGGLVQYDSRDDVASPTRGKLLSANVKLYGKYLGGAYNYEMVELEYRQFVNVFRPRSTLGWVVKTQSAFGDVPFSELPSFGSPFDLRGYYMGKYRDKSMAYSIVEYRHMCGSPEKYKSGSFWSKCGYVIWGGAGTIGESVKNWNKVKFNYGVGFRFQMQPGKNFRVDVGKEPGQKGFQFYMNMTEAF